MAAFPDCALTDISPTAEACTNWVEGNLLNGDPASIAAQIAALASLCVTWDGDWAAVDATRVNAGGDSTFDFAGFLDGQLVIGITIGEAEGVGEVAGDGWTGFFRLTADNLDEVTLNLRGASSAVVYGGNVVPEPATWAMMMLGFGAIGFAMRRNRNGHVAIG